MNQLQITISFQVKKKEKNVPVYIWLKLNYKMYSKELNNCHANSNLRITISLQPDGLNL